MIALCNRYNVHPITVLVFLTSLAFGLTAALPAWAQSIDATDFSVDFTPLAEQVIAIAVMGLTLAAGIVSKFVVSWFASKTKMQDAQFEALAAQRVDEILRIAIDHAESWAKVEVADPRSPLKKVQIDNFFVREAVRYATRSMPDLISYFNLTEERISDMIKARLNGMTRTPEADSGSPELVTS